MKIKEKIKQILSIMDKFDTSEDRIVKTLRYELYFVAIIILMLVGLRLFFESWLLITFLPAKWFENIIPEVRLLLDPVIVFSEYEFDFLTIIPFLWYFVVFIATTLIIIKVKRIFRDLIIKTANLEENGEKFG